MGCSKCGRQEVIFQNYSGLHLCRDHFREDLLHKAKKTVRQNSWLVPGKRYAVALSGGLVSCALLDFMYTLVGKRKDIGLVAMTIQTTGNVAMERSRIMTGTYGVPWIIAPDADDGEKDLQIRRDGSENMKKFSPFLFHESIERQLVLKAEELEIDALVFGYTLEDHASRMLWDIISGNISQKTLGEKVNPKKTSIIRPFMHIPRQELLLFSGLFLDLVIPGSQENNNLPASHPIEALLSDFSSRHPGAPYALVNTGEQIKKLLDMVT